MTECGREWGECEVTEAEHECDNAKGHTGDHHCGYCNEHEPKFSWERGTLP